MNSSVVLIGPTLPYRGGIARHTTMLHRALHTQARALTISFSRQYPRWLYPGTHDTDEDLRDYKEPGVEYLIDSLNPKTWTQAVARMREFAPRTVVMPWWHVYWTPCFSWIARAARRMNSEVVFLCHNSVEHENTKWKQRLSYVALSTADRFITHTYADRDNLQRQFKAPIQVHPHPTFDWHIDKVHPLPRRARIELLFFGFIRPYKGLDILLEAMKALRHEDIHLSVVGEFWQNEAAVRRFIEDNRLDSKVELVARYVSDREAAAYFMRSDVVVLPYRSATGSGVIPLAYHFRKPVIATRTGGLPDVVVDGQTGLLVDPESPTALAAGIASVLTGQVQFDPRAIDRIASRLTWDGLAREILRAPLTSHEPNAKHR
jgi:glycosyltransferase involved in cell wall biosynthesis